MSLSKSKEIEIVADRMSQFQGRKSDKLLPLASVRLTRITRDHPRVRRGASVRAAISIAELTSVLMVDGAYFETAFMHAALLALPTRIEIERDMDSEKSAHEEAQALIRDWATEVLATIQGPNHLKKKT